MGCAELYQHLTSFAVMASAMHDEGYEKYGDCPGVFDQEVSCSFGVWFANELLISGSVPDTDKATKELEKLNNEFWDQFEEN